MTGLGGNDAADTLGDIQSPVATMAEGGRADTRQPLSRVVSRAQGLDVLPTPTPTPEVDAALAALPSPAELPYVEAPTPNSIEGIICSFNWPQGCEYWIALAFCESSLRLSVVGYAGAYVGLFQVWLGHGYAYAWLLNPYNNTLAAWELSTVEIEGVKYGGINTAPWPYCQYQ